MTTEGLGRRVDDQIDSMVEGSLHEWGGEGGIHDGDRAPQPADDVQVGEGQGGIGGSLGKDHGGASRFDRSDPGIGIGDIDKADLDAETRAHLGEQLRGPREELALGHHMAAL